MRGFKTKTNNRRERRQRRSLAFGRLKIHPLFLLVGVWYAFTGDLFLFLVSTLVALQHECAHAFAAAKLGYKLRSVVLMPFGAVIDGDLRGISLKDEISVAISGPLCNLFTALLFGAIWWFAPTMYAFTDTAYYASLSIALVNLLPLYPLDGGRIFKCLLARALQTPTRQPQKAERLAATLCRAVTLFFAALLLLLFVLQWVKAQPNFTLLAFSLFLLFGGIGNKNKSAVYEKIDFSLPPPLRCGLVVKRVAIDGDCPIKDALRFLEKGSYLVLEVYDEGERRLFDLPQSKLSALFMQAKTPYDSLKTAYFAENPQ